jgi:hypothetical protein
MKGTLKKCEFHILNVMVFGKPEMKTKASTSWRKGYFDANQLHLKMNQYQRRVLIKNPYFVEGEHFYIFLCLNKHQERFIGPLRCVNVLTSNHFCVGRVTRSCIFSF